MRDIKFRGKRIIDGKWIYGVPYLDGGWHIMIDSNTATPEEGTGSWSVDPATVGQFTGLTDKNGKEIFEGDMIHAMGSLDLIVKWDSGNTCFFADYDATRDVIDDDRDDFCNACDFSTYYVIGNIHEHSEEQLSKANRL